MLSIWSYLLSEDRSTLELPPDAIVALILAVVLATFFGTVRFAVCVLCSLAMARLAVRTKVHPLAFAAVLLEFTEREKLMALGAEFKIQRNLHERPCGEVILPCVAATAENPDRSVCVVLEAESQGRVALALSPKHLSTALRAKHGLGDDGFDLSHARDVLSVLSRTVPHCADLPVKDAVPFALVPTI